MGELTVIGSLALVGGLIDFVMSKVQRDRLKTALEGWWLRFDYVDWGNFGRKETELAVAILDRWAGPRFWSRRRWGFTLVVSVSAGLVAGLCGFALRAAHGLSTSFSDLYFAELLCLPGIVVGLALSLSLSRTIATHVGRWCRGTRVDALLFLAMVAFHWLLFAYWSAVTLSVSFVPIVGTAALFGWESPQAALHDLLDVVRGYLPELAGGWFPVPRMPLQEFYFDANLANGSFAIGYGLFKLVMDALSNGLRICFALVFAASFAFRPLIQKPISWFWLRALESGKPIFTVVFGTIGIVVRLAYLVLDN